MADFKEFVFSDDFRAYRKKQVMAIAEYVHGLIQADNIKDLAGALGLARKIIGLPGQLVNDDNLLEQLNNIIKEDMASITRHLVYRRFLEEQ